MRIAVGADHAGFPLKDLVLELLEKEGHSVVDLGTHSTQSVDYPDYAQAVGESVVKGIDRRGSRRWTRSAPRSVGAKNAPPKRGKLVRLGSAQGQFQRAIRWGTERTEPLSIAKVF